MTEVIWKPVSPIVIHKDKKGFTREMITENKIDIMLKSEDGHTYALDRETGREIANVKQAKIEYDVEGVPVIHLEIECPHKALFYSQSK